MSYKIIPVGHTFNTHNIILYKILLYNDRVTGKTFGSAKYMAIYLNICRVCRVSKI